MDDWIKKDLKYIWHPYTQMKDCQKLPPILIKKAKGIKLFDSAGNYYYDTISSWWCNVHGHNHHKINKAINQQLKNFAHILFAGFTHEPAIALAEKLVKITPKNLTKVFFSDNGSTAVEVALKMSFQYWHNIGEKNKQKFICLDYGYHGDTIGTMSVAATGLFNQIFKPLFFSSYKIPSPYCYRCPIKKEKISCQIGCLKPLEKLLQDKHQEIAGLIIEPMVLAAGGMIVYPAEYLAKLATLTKKYNIHLIFDEVATGFGRSGKMFAFEYVGATPDFLCLSKGLTSGYLPLAVTLTTQKIAQAFYADYEKKKTFYHGHTYTANPVACTAALASLDIFRQEHTLEKIKKIIPIFHQGLEQFRSIDIVGDARAIGLIGAIELVKNKETKEAFSFNQRIGYKIYQDGLKQHLVLRPLGNIIYFYLPLCVTKSQVSKILQISFNIIKKYG